MKCLQTRHVQYRPCGHPWDFSFSGIPSDYFSEQRINAQIEAITFVSDFKIPLVPQQEDILPIGIPVVEPVEQKTEDTDARVVLDIALQALGLVEGEQLLDQILKDPDVDTALHEVMPSLKTKDWENVLKLLEHIVQLLITHGILKSFAAISARRIAFRLSLRCVPILGLAYVIAAFLVALKANYHRFSFA